jgi:hypothetical protein
LEWNIIYKWLIKLIPYVWLEGVYIYSCLRIYIFVFVYIIYLYLYI